MVPKVSILPPKEGHWRFLIPRGKGVLQANFFEETYDAKLEFPGGGGESAKQKICHGGTMDIFWNYTFDYQFTASM